jgi:hypothetical protein
MTAQIADIIYLQNRKMHLLTNPLELYWIRNNKDRPEFVPTETCKRGYVATWEIKDEQLFLKKIEGTYLRTNFFLAKKPVSYSLKNFFSLRKTDDIRASWFSGKLRIPVAKMTQYVDSNYDSRFEKEQILTINNGEVVKNITLDFTHRKLVVTSY